MTRSLAWALFHLALTIFCVWNVAPFFYHSLRDGKWERVTRNEWALLFLAGVEAQRVYAHLTTLL